MPRIRRRPSMKRIARRTVQYGRKLRGDIKKEIAAWGFNYGLRIPNLVLRTNREWKTLLSRYHSVDELVQMPPTQTAAFASFVLLVNCETNTDLCAVALEQPNSSFFTKFADTYFSGESSRVIQKKLLLTAKKLKQEFQKIFAAHDLQITSPLEGTYTFQGTEHMAFPVVRRKRIEVLR